MQQTVDVRTPVHLWIVGLLSLLWNCFGGYDYVMTRARDLAYLSKSMPGVDPKVTLAWIDGMPFYAQAGWGIGVWGGLLGAILLLLRSRYTVWAFALSLLGAVLSLGYQMFAAPPLAGAGAASKIMAYVIIALAVGQLWYAHAMEKRGVLR